MSARLDLWAGALAALILAGGAASGGCAAALASTAPVDTAAPLSLLPPPPPEGSAAAIAELGELHRIEAVRSAAEFAAAQWDADHEDATAFAATLGPGFELSKLPATARLLDEVRAEAAEANRAAKAAFMRRRPWVVDPSLSGCRHSTDKSKFAYPSGHTTMAFATAIVLADLAPDRAQAVLHRADAYAYNRLVCGAHFPSDVAGGRTLGTVVGLDAIHAADYAPQRAAARRELRAAGVSTPD